MVAVAVAAAAAHGHIMEDLWKWFPLFSFFFIFFSSRPLEWGAKQHHQTKTSKCQTIYHRNSAAKYKSTFTFICRRIRKCAESVHISRERERNAISSLDCRLMLLMRKREWIINCSAAKKCRGWHKRKGRVSFLFFAKWKAVERLFLTILNNIIYRTGGGGEDGLGRAIKAQHALIITACCLR